MVQALMLFVWFNIEDKMKFLIMAACVLGCAYAVEDSAAEILKNEYEVHPDGGYHYVYESSNGISSQANAVLKQVGKDEAFLEVSGSNSFQSPEGETYQITFVANENGYQPQGNHLPTPPPEVPIPPYIIRALEYIKEHPYQEKQL